MREGLTSHDIEILIARALVQVACGKERAGRLCFSKCRQSVACWPLAFGCDRWGLLVHAFFETHSDRIAVCFPGDTLSRLFEYSGAIVDRVSHVGDLGLPVALVMAAMEHADTLRSTNESELLNAVVTGAYEAGCLPSPTQLSELYLFAKRTEAQQASENASQFVLAFSVRVRDLLRDIQLGELAQASTRALWDRLLASSRRGYDELYTRLRVEVQERGESTYVNELAPTVTQLLEHGTAHHSEGAVVVPIPLAGAPPIIIQKSDGG